MKFLTRLGFILLLFLIFQSCTKKEQEISIIQEDDQEQEMVTSYKEAVEYLNKGDTFYAAKKFLESEMLLPQSEWAPKSALMAAYAYYLQDFYSEAIFNLERFIQTYPGNKNESYAHFLLAMCYFETIVDETKDLAPIINAKNKFQFIIDKYPETDFAKDAKFKVDLITDVLAAKELYIGRHYLKKEKWIAAINRFKKVTNEYQTTIYVEEAIHRLVEIYYYIGLRDESKKYATLLGYNYGTSEWYKASYKIFNKEYKNRILKVDKKEKKGILKKFKKLFE